MINAGAKPKAAPTVGYFRSDPADHPRNPRAKPRATPAADQQPVDQRTDAFLQTEAELIALLSGFPEDPIENFEF